MGTMVDRLAGRVAPQEGVVVLLDGHGPADEGAGYGDFPLRGRGVFRNARGELLEGVLELVTHVRVADMLNDRVLPFFEEQGVALLRILTEPWRNSKPISTSG